MLPLSKTTLSPQALETSLTELREVGPLALFPTANTSRFCTIISDLMKQIPDLDKYIGQTIQGRGYDRSYTYTLTFDGMALILKILNINAVVVRSLADLKTAISKNFNKFVLISDRGTLHLGEPDHFPYALCIEKEKEVVHLSISNCHNYYFCSKNFASTVFPNLKVITYLQKNKIFEEGYVIDSSYAIDAAANFEKLGQQSKITDPEKQKQYIGNGVEVYFPREDEPFRVLSLDGAIERQIDYQIMIIRHLFNQMPKSNPMETGESKGEDKLSVAKLDIIGKEINKEEIVTQNPSNGFLSTITAFVSRLLKSNQ